MKRFILVLLTFMLLFFNVYAADLPIPDQIIKEGKKYQLNMNIVESTGYAVYGSPEDVPDNDKDTATEQYRYLGFDLNGNLFSNIEFPDDANSGRADRDRNWIKEPWEVKGENGKFLCKKSNINRDSDAVEWLDRLEIGGEWTGSKLIDYFNIQSPGGDYSTGSARGWHTVNNKPWYKTFVIPPMIKLVTNNKELGYFCMDDLGNPRYLHYNKKNEKVTFKIYEFATPDEIYDYHVMPSDSELYKTETIDFSKTDKYWIDLELKNPKVIGKGESFSTGYYITTSESNYQKGVIIRQYYESKGQNWGTDFHKAYYPDSSEYDNKNVMQKQSPSKWNPVYQPDRYGYFWVTIH